MEKGLAERRVFGKAWSKGCWRRMCWRRVRSAVGTAMAGNDAMFLVFLIITGNFKDMFSDEKFLTVRRRRVFWIGNQYRRDVCICMSELLRCSTLFNDGPLTSL